MDGRPDNLPLRLTSFVGRDQEVAELRAALAAHRLVTLTGPAGCGKTRLALEVVDALLPDVPDGVCLVELAAVAEPALVGHAVAGALGVRDRPGSSILEGLEEALRDRSVLLVVDNCEHLIGATADVAERLLRTSPNLRLLATSREPLAIPGETVLRVPPLEVPDPRHLPATEQLTCFGAVRLFAERARSAARDFALTAQNADAVVRICRQLDGIPLAIELAAAWAPTLSPHQIAERLHDRFRLLASNRRGTSPRHQTLRGAIAWSYDLLGPDERTLLARLSVFMGGASLEAIEATSGGDGLEGDVVATLARLVDRSLLSVEEQPTGRRYRLLETVRLYARERLVTGGAAESAHARHARYFLDLAEAAEPDLWGPDLAGVLNRLEAEHENLRAALRWATGRGEAEVAQRLGAALARFWHVRGHIGEGLRWLEAALAWRGNARRETRARALDAAGQLARDRGDYSLATARYEEALGLRRELGDRRGAALTLTNLGVIAQFRGDDKAAVGLHEESLRCFQELGDERGAALALISLATMAQLRGQVERASAKYQEALAAFCALGDARGVAACLNNLGNLASQRGDLAAAFALYEESVAAFRGLGDQREVAACLRNMATVARDSGDEERALRLARESLALYAALEDRRGSAGCLVFLSEVAVRRSPAQAARLLGALETLDGGPDSPGHPLEPRRRQLVEALQRCLGPAALAGELRKGAGLDLPGAIAEALADAPSPSPLPRTGEPVSTLLTPRQMEVAILVARGMTNRQIAEALFISERTADTHVEHLLARLGVQGRAQVASWAVANGLLETAPR